MRIGGIAPLYGFQSKRRNLVLRLVIVALARGRVQHSRWLLRDFRLGPLCYPSISLLVHPLQAPQPPLVLFLAAEPVHMA